MENIRSINVAGQDVVLDSEKLSFSEATLSEYLEKEGGWIDYFGAKLAEAERESLAYEIELERAEDDYERVFSTVFTRIKSSNKGSDKFVEGLAILDPEVVEAKKELLEARTKLIDLKYNVKMLQQHLRAWDKNHENAQNRGNTLRKEMERVSKDVILEEQIDKIVKGF